MKTMKSICRFRFFIPYRVAMVKQISEGGHIGLKRVYLFGVLVAEIQITEPWS